MAYERTNWQNGDVISSEKLNKMEAGLEYACSLEHEVEDPTEGQVLKYDAEKEKFVNADVPAAIETNIQNPTDGQTLKYDAASGKWVNGEGGSGSSTLVVTGTEDNDVITLDHTWQEIYDAFPNVEMIVGDDRQRVFITSVRPDDQGYMIVAISLSPNNTTIYSTDSPSGYPTTSSDGGGSDPIG
jgi:hypothetical protein